jgi:hypothetical protein
VISFEVRWSLPSLDEMYVKFLSSLLRHCQRIAERHSALHSFVYLNYAADDQDPHATLRQKGKLEELKKVRDEYDERHFLERHLKQPFKLDE